QQQVRGIGSVAFCCKQRVFALMSSNERLPGLVDECGFQECGYSRSSLQISDPSHTQERSEIGGDGVGGVVSVEFRFFKRQQVGLLFEHFDATVEALGNDSISSGPPSEGCS